MKEIPGLVGYYATNDGLIVSVRSGQSRVLSQRIHKDYLHVQVKRGIGRATKAKLPVHQLVLLAFKGEKKSVDSVSRHLNGNPLDNRICNLEWGTIQENIQDSIRHGTAVCLRLGEKHPRAKMRDNQVVRIKELIGQGLTNKDIAYTVGVKPYNVQDIRKGVAWKHIPQGA